MKRYEEYKDTGIGWLPKLPSHWKLEQLRKYIRLVSKKDTLRNNYYLLLVS